MLRVLDSQEEASGGQFTDLTVADSVVPKLDITLHCY